MTMSPRARKLALTAHITASVGWLGGVTAALVLAVAGLASSDAQTVRAVYVALELVAWFVLVPFSFASLVTGLVQSLGSVWGLFRHYWVLAKLVIDLFATAVLLVYTRTLGQLADIAAETGAADDLSGLRSPSPTLHAAAAVLLLVLATILAVYKPQGVTPYGWRKQRERNALRRR